MRGETLHEHDDCLVRKDGSIMPVTFSMSPFELPDGLGSVTAFSDVEERRRAERVARERDVAEARAEELRAARRRVIEAADAARARLERDLHDGAQQEFVSAVMTLRLAERLMATDPERARALRESSIELADDGLAELRRLAAGIHPGALTDGGLGKAIQALTARLPLDVAIEEELPERLPAPVEASVYFFVSEALTNTVKHARAVAARVRIAAVDHELTVEVADDGVGGAQADSGGSGIRGLGDRVGALDGALELHSPPGGGTLLRARIPLPGSEQRVAPVDDEHGAGHEARRVAREVDDRRGDLLGRGGAPHRRVVDPARAEARLVDGRHLRLHVAGRERVDPHAVRRPLGRQRLRELVHGRLGGVVGRLPLRPVDDLARRSSRC